VSRTSLDWSDPIAVSKWLIGLRAAFNDADAIAIDMLRAPRTRELGPRLHAKNYGEARKAILASIDYAIRPEHGPGDAGGSGTGPHH